MKLNGRRIPTRRAAAIPVLGLAGLLGVAACTSGAPAATPAAQQPPPASAPPASPASTPPAAPASTPPAVPAAQPSLSLQQVAQWVANTAVGNESLSALQWSEGRATFAGCYPSTVSSAPAASTDTSALCDVAYSDGSVWRQTVTITLDSQDSPASDWTNAGTELSQPASGNNSGYENYLRAENQAQDEMYGAIDAQGPGITTNGDNDAGTGEDDNGG
jgi:hypothetical protein